MQKILSITILLSLALSLSALAFRDGEKLVFDVRYGLVSAAEATLEVKSDVYRGREVWHLSTKARTYPFFDVFFRVRDTVESWWDKESLLPHKFAKNLQEGTYRQHRIHHFDHNQKSTTYQKWSFKDKRFNSEQLEIPITTQDVLSAFYHVRNQELKPGKRLTMSITSDGRSLSTDIVVHRREKVKSIFGTIQCLVIEPKLKGEGVFKQSGKITIWITDDAFKIPVKLESAVTFGSFVATLKTAENVPYIIK
ncbi:MAG: DUF3108 domain-containing protein [Candidatus Cloacimonadaceae bacterium]|nr:DUF3108 domain-containing protein [Candidatus Cloacimonadaceae bacterium]MDP3113577.1 DUF3108 domain-containing protein [Candidatus Cloacimonadaceae bacterium]